MTPWKLVLLAVSALLLAACSPAATSPSVTGSAGAATVGLTYIPNPQFAPMYVADSLGYFDDEDADVELRHHGSNEGLFTALLAGSEDFVLAGAGEMMQARAEGSDLIAIASYYREYPVRIIVPESSSATEAADLAGKKIGIPGRYGESWFGLQAFLDSGDLTHDDVDIVEIGYTQQAALTTGKVDAVVGYVNNDSVSFDRAGFAVRDLPVADEVGLVSVSLITTREYAEDNPATARAVAAAMVRGIETTVDDPSQALDICADYIPDQSGSAAQASSEAVLNATIGLFTADGGPDGRLSREQFESMAEFMKSKAIISTNVDGADSMTNDYVS